MNLKDFGIRIDNLKESILPYLFLTFLGSLIIIKFFILSSNFPELLAVWRKTYIFPFSFIYLSIIQEIIFRGGLMYLLRKYFKNVIVVVVLNTLPFVLMHLLFSFPTSISLFSILGGLSFALVYYYYPNLILASAAHVILNSLVIPYCTLKLVNC